ncbi:homeodomain transcription factor ste12 [Dinochytrium kinnereticum]|nr:homeodomain transcription factor ste12 [Dinochytrium kinnereticum]
MAPPPSAPLATSSHHPLHHHHLSTATAAAEASGMQVVGNPALSSSSSGMFGNPPDTLEILESLKLFLATAPSTWDPDQVIKHFTLPSGENVSCVLWNNLFHITGTDIVRSLTFRFAAFGRPVKNMKKFEEGVFSDLRNLKPGIDATLEEPRSEFLEFLFKANSIRTQKKQKVFYWFSVPHDRLFMDALERDLKRESLGIEPTTVAIHPMPLTATIELAKQQCLLSIPKGPPATDPWVSDYMADTPGSTAPQLPSHSTHLMHPTLRSGDPFDEKGGVGGAPSNLIEYAAAAAAAAAVGGGGGGTGISHSPAMSHQTMGAMVGSPSLMGVSTGGDPPHGGLGVGGDDFELSSASAAAAAAAAGSNLFNPVFSLFEGSPNYKQRRRAQSLLSNGRSANRASSVSSDLAAGTGGVGILHSNVSSVSSSPVPGHLDHSGIDIPRVHTCTFESCGKKFKRFEHLRRHMRCHTGERPYVCPLEGCGKGFSRSDNLSCHMKVHGFTPEQIAASRSPTPNLHAASSQGGGQSRHPTPASMMSESPEMAHLNPPNGQVTTGGGGSFSSSSSSIMSLNITTTITLTRPPRMGS